MRMLCKCLSRESERGGKEDDKTRENLTDHIIISTHHHIITLSHHQRKQERISESPGPSSQDVSSYISADGWTVD